LFFLFFIEIVIKISLLFSRHSSSGKMKKIKILTGIAITTLLIMSFMALLASAATLPVITLSASSAQLPIMLPTGTTFNGSISTTGTVRFWVSAPNGAQIVNLGLIDKTTAFSFIAEQNGNYTMNFENDLTNSIQVNFSYVTNPDISSGNNSSGIPFVYLVISIVIAVLGSILIIFFVRRKNKINNSETYDALASSPIAVPTK
jgi:flagellar basal body-associated protein FliL